MEKMLILTHKGNLLDTTGMDEKTWNRLLRNYMEALDKDQIASAVVYLDNERILPFPASAISWEAMNMLRNLIRSKRDTERPDYLLIIGGDEVVPMARLPDHLDRDRDRPLLSDSYYVDFDLVIPDRDPQIRADHTPQIAVGRILSVTRGQVGERPDCSAEQFLVRQIEQATAVHRAHAIGPGERGNKRALVSASRQHDARGAYKPLDQTLQTLSYCPPTRADARQPDDIHREWFENNGVIFMNLHHDDEKPLLIGAKKEIEIPFLGITIPLQTVIVLGSCCFCPEGRNCRDVKCPDGSRCNGWCRQVDLSGLICLAAVCNGARVAGKGLCQSVCLSMFARGLLAFVGGTSEQFGPICKLNAATGLLGAYYLFGMLIGHLAAGQTLGAALQRTKKNARIDNWVDGKNVLTLTLYGDPSIGLSHFFSREFYR